MTTTNVRTQAIQLPGGQSLRVSLFGGQENGRLLVSKGYDDGLAIAGLDGESTLVVPASVRDELIEALRRLEEGEE